MRGAGTAVAKRLITELRIQTSVISAHAASMQDYCQRVEKRLKLLSKHLSNQENLYCGCEEPKNLAVGPLLPTAKKKEWIE